MNRSRILALIVLMGLGSSCLLEAQQPYSVFYVGARGGLTRSDLSVKYKGEEFKSDAINGGGVGMQFGYAISPVFAMQLDLFWSKKGAENIGGDVVDEIRLSYFTFPFMAIVRFPTSSSVKARLFAGPYFSFETGCDAKAPDPEDPGQTIDVDCDIEGIGGKDSGGMFGIGIEFGMKFHGFIDASYTVGVTNLRAGGFEDDEIKTRVFLLTVGTYFEL